jgi:D-lactate dehydrogenase (cytochrome)
VKIVTGIDEVTSGCAQILSDESRWTLGVPCSVCYPETIEDLRAVVGDAAARALSITTVGAQTGITGSSVPDDGCVAICLEKMDRIVAVDLRGGSPTLTCQPGITLDTIAAFCRNPAQCQIPGCEQLTPGAWFYPPDPTEMSSQLGGTVATNASGARSFRFGPTRNHIVGATIVLASGETLTLNRGDHSFHGGCCTFSTDQCTSYSLPALTYRSLSIKNAAGYYAAFGMDLLDLFIGSEGTLGIFAEIVIRLTSAQPILAGLSFFKDRTDAFAFANWLRPIPAVAAIEYFDSTSLECIQQHKNAISLALPEFPPTGRTAIYWEFIEEQPGIFEANMEHWEEVLQAHGSSFDATWSGFEPDERVRLKTFRHAVPELVNFKIARLKEQCPLIRKIGTDAAVPAECFEKFFNDCVNLIDINGLQSVIFGHLGDYHLHINMLPTSESQLDIALDVYRQLMDFAIAVNGTVSAEHGIGKLKRTYLAKMVGPDALCEMQGIKSMLDHQWLLNRGTLFEFPHE